MISHLILPCFPWTHQVHNRSYLLEFVTFFFLKREIMCLKGKLCWRDLFPFKGVLLVSQEQFVLQVKPRICTVCSSQGLQTWRRTVFRVFPPWCLHTNQSGFAYVVGEGHWKIFDFISHACINTQATQIVTIIILIS